MHSAGRFALTRVVTPSPTRNGRSLIETHTIASLHNIFVALFFDRQKKKFVGNGDSHKVQQVILLRRCAERNSLLYRWRLARSPVVTLDCTAQALRSCMRAITVSFAPSDLIREKAVHEARF
jgi:hypothetical protein